jgi:DNA-binding NarL/FixJ family response regulator
MKKPRILLADDHPVILDALCGVLEDGVAEVVGRVTDGQALVDAAQQWEPDVIITDISMPKLNGLEATHALQICVPRSKVIILTVHREPVYVTWHSMLEPAVISSSDPPWRNCRKPFCICSQAIVISGGG